MDIVKCGVMGRQENFRLDRQQGTFQLTRSDQCSLFYAKGGQWIAFELDQPVAASATDEGLMSIAALASGTPTAELRYDAREESESEIFQIAYVAPMLSLSVDANRDGVVDHAEQGKENWVWGSGQRGAILLVNNDRDLTDFDPDGKHKSELALLLVHDPGVEFIPLGYSMRLFCTRQAAERFSVYRLVDGQPEIILGLTPTGRSLSVSPPLQPMRQELFVEGHQFPGPFFEGLITIELQLVKEVPSGSVVLTSDRVVFRVAPWVMTPNHLPAKQVYTCDMSQTNYPNPKIHFGSERSITGHWGSPPHCTTQH